MAFDAGAAQAVLGLDISPFRQGMLEAEGISQLFPSVVRNFLANPLLGVVDVLQRVRSGLVGIFTEATNQADALGDLAASVGVAVEDLSGMSLVASQAGSGLSAVADAYRILGRNQAEFIAGNRAAVEAFQSLGVSPVDAMGNIRPLHELLLDVADAMSRLPEGGMQTRAAMELLGRSGTELIPTLQQGSAEIRRQIELYRAYGAVVTAEAVQSADAWGDAMGELQIAWTGIKNQLAEPIRATLLPYLLELLDWVRSHPDEVRAELEELGRGIASALITGAEAVKSLADNVEELALILGAVGLGSSIASSLVLIWDLVNALKWLRTGFVETAAAATAAGPAIHGAAAGGAGAGGGRIGRTLAGATLAGATVYYGAGALGLGDNAQAAGGVGAGAGSVVGGTVGSFVPGIGTLVGGIIGALLGGGAGLLYGASADRREEAERSRVDVSGLGRAIGDLRATASEVEPAMGRLPEIFKEIDRQAAAAVPNLDRVNALMDGILDGVASSPVAGGVATTAATSIDRSTHLSFGDVVVPPVDLNEATTQIATKIRGPVRDMIEREMARLDGQAMLEVVRRNS